MRIRSVKPEFWRDRPLATLSADARLFYIGLWMEADDAGWLNWDLAEIAADLYPYRPAHSRERQVERYASELMALPGRARIDILDCGHARLPRLTDHQRFGGKRSLLVLHKHESVCDRDQARTFAEDRGRSATGGEVKGGVPPERKGKGGTGGSAAQTNGATHSADAIDELVVMAKDPSSPGHGAARKALAKRAPERLAELDAEAVVAAEPSEAVARPRRAAGA